MARRTSVWAFRKILRDGLLSERRQEVYEYIYLHGPCSNKQITDALTKHTHLRSDSFRPRVAELVKRRVVEQVGIEVDPGTKNEVILWDVTPDLPVEPSPKIRLSSMNKAFDKCSDEKKQEILSVIKRMIRSEWRH